VSFRKKRYTGLVWEVLEHPVDQWTDSLATTDRIIGEHPILSQREKNFWSWISSYYSCTLGEVMRAALPAGYRLTSESHVSVNENIKFEELLITDEEVEIIDFIKAQSQVTVEDAVKYSTHDRSLALIQSMVSKNYLNIFSSLKKLPERKKIEWISVNAPYDRLVDDAFALCKKSVHQTYLLLGIYQAISEMGYIKKTALHKIKGYSAAHLKALEKKGIVQITVSMLNPGVLPDQYHTPLSAAQLTAYNTIREADRPSLLHGITGSGKTHIYIKYISEILAEGGQVLFMLPEVALTTQLVSRLQDYFSHFLHVYHYRTTQHQRLMIWEQARLGSPMLIVGPRSTLFIPCRHLSLIIVDESHDTSYKQHEPAPRYHGRDAALYVAQQEDIPIILGSATPSAESYYNAHHGKYKYVPLMERYGDATLPDITLIDRTKEDYLSKQKIISSSILDEITKTLSAKKQVLLFLNRRGFFTMTFCTSCGWKAMCPHCDVSLTYHKYSRQLRCHSCGYSRNNITDCPDCGHPITVQDGYGTQRVEEELSALLPDHTISRLDADVSRSISKYEKTLQQFQDRQTDILIGTQMITKGLDFEHVGLVGVLQGDQLLHFPDFRSVEYTFQLLTQVAGRAGRKKDPGKVFIQTFLAQHPVYDYIINHDQDAFYKEILKDRKAFLYPPFTRIIHVEIRHKNKEQLIQAVNIWQANESKEMVSRKSGPAIPSQERLQGYYRRTLTYKSERSKKIIEKIKRDIQLASTHVLRTKGLSQTRFIVDVDPV